MPIKMTFRPVIPRANYFVAGYESWYRAMGRALTGPVAKLLEDEFEKRAKGWDHAITFKTVFQEGAKGPATARRLRIDVGPFGKNKRYWVFVSGGVGGHSIYPKEANRRLWIKKGYKSRTDVGDVYGRRWAYEGPYYYMPPGWGVYHPGNEPREFEKHIKEKNEKKIYDILLRASAAALAAVTRG